MPSYQVSHAETLVRGGSPYLAWIAGFDTSFHFAPRKLTEAHSYSQPTFHVRQTVKARLQSFDGKRGKQA
jgi:hypothetical protein